MKKLFIIIGFLCVMATVSFGETWCHFVCRSSNAPAQDKLTCGCGGIDVLCACPLGYINMSGSDNECECVKKATCTGNQTYNETDNTCQNGLPELNLKDFEVTKLEADDGSFIIELTRNSGSYIYTLVLEMDDNQHPTVIRRYCKGNAFCNTLSQGIKCEESNWSDWCYKEE
ncbi:MAG: hypothetical protein J6Q05_04555 [Elusimicrobiaceae bacterium]|nr:hypothetical protein [Elusimicrobiaceae bacterium]